MRGRKRVLRDTWDSREGKKTNGPVDTRRHLETGLETVRGPHHPPWPVVTGRHKPTINLPSPDNRTGS